MPVKAPFNFVPLGEKVYFPQWADLVSHDIPFEDYQSGYIDVTVTAETPLFIRNGHGRSEVDNTFSHIIDENNRKKYFIPASTMKGAIRNVLKILSFGKMQIDKNLAVAQREFYNENLYTLKKKQSEIKGGWLRKDKDGEIYLYPAKNIHRIALSRIDSSFKNIFKEGESFQKYFDKNNSGINLNNKITLDSIPYDPKTASFKYALFGETGPYRFSTTSKNKKLKRVKYNKSGNINGYLVFTGQSAKTSWVSPEELDNSSHTESSRKKNDAKFYDFVFETETGNQEEQKIPISKDMFQQYAHYIYRDNPDWLEGIKKMNSEPGMPVFYRTTQDNTQDNKIQDFGLALLYKLPYNRTPLEIVKEPGKDIHDKKTDWNQPDFAETIFGYSNEASSLKGRVQFSHFWQDVNIKVYNEDVGLTLSTPKVSYYPIYVKQSRNNGNGKYQTYNDGIISGWKRYILRNGTWGVITNQNQINRDRDSIVRPIAKSGTFKGKIVFHNLKKVELGALLSALTFHGSENCYHQIGQGKPYGFGKISLKLETVSVNGSNYEKEKQIDLMNEFEVHMNDNCITKWKETPSIRELLQLSNTSVGKDDNRFKYMIMSTSSRNNEFVQAKKNKEYLELFSVIQEKISNNKSKKSDK